MPPRWPLEKLREHFLDSLCSDHVKQLFYADCKEFFDELTEKKKEEAPCDLSSKLFLPTDHYPIDSARTKLKEIIKKLQENLQNERFKLNCLSCFFKNASLQQLNEEISSFMDAINGKTIQADPYPSMKLLRS